MQNGMSKNLNVVDMFLHALVGNPQGPAGLQCCTRPPVDRDDLDAMTPHAYEDTTPQSKVTRQTHLGKDSQANLPARSKAITAAAEGIEPEAVGAKPVERTAQEEAWERANPDAGAAPPPAAKALPPVAAPKVKHMLTEEQRSALAATPIAAKVEPRAEPAASASKQKPKAKAKKKAAAQCSSSTAPLAEGGRQEKGGRVPNKKSYFAEIKERNARHEREKGKYDQLVADIMAGKYKDQGGNGQKAGNMRITMPTPYERTNTRMIVLEGFRAQYRKLGKHSSCPSAIQSAKEEEERLRQATSLIPTYNDKQVDGLQIEGGHRPLARPRNIVLPKDFRKPWNKKTGIVTLKELGEHDCNSKGRLLVSVYGDVFDVSDRPDKYGPNGPYYWMTGHDLTWGFVSGKDTPDTVDQYYDLWKIAPETFRDDKQRCILAWVAFYEYEYGESIGKLEKYKVENGLPGPPMEESNGDCSVM